MRAFLFLALRPWHSGPAVPMRRRRGVRATLWAPVPIAASAPSSNAKPIPAASAVTARKILVGRGMMGRTVRRQPSSITGSDKLRLKAARAGRRTSSCARTRESACA
jgi:hypothetical protein